MAAHELELSARALVAEGKGILAADETTGTVTKRLDALDIESSGRQPWALSFSYPRALQDAALETRKGEEENSDPANRACYRRGQLVHAARLGEYSEEVAA
jgi:fructose-bisphosphate aldolase, class I